MQFLTMRQSVGALNGSGAGVPGRLGLCTSCASRMKALSGSASNDGIVEVGFCAGMLTAIGDLGDMGLCDISGVLVKLQTRFLALIQY